MCPSTSWPLSSVTRNIVLGRASETSPSISILSSLLKLPSCAATFPEGRLQLAHVDGLGALLPGLLVVGHLGVLLERLEPRPVDARVMHEEVSVTLVRRDESVALLVVEPLDRTGRHAFVLPLSPPRRSRRDPGCGHNLFPELVRIPRQKYHPERLKGASRSEYSAALEGGFTRAFFQEAANRVLQVLGGEQGR